MEFLTVLAFIAVFGSYDATSWALLYPDRATAGSARVDEDNAADMTRAHHVEVHLMGYNDNQSDGGSVNTFVDWGQRRLEDAMEERPPARAIPARDAAAPPKLQAAAVMHSELVLSGKPLRPQQHSASIVETEPGVLLAAWFAGTWEREPDVGIWTARRRLDGSAWDPPQEVVRPVKGVPTWNPVLLKYGEEILLFYKVGLFAYSWSGWLVRSSDGGRTWGKPRRLGKGCFGPAKNKPLVLSDGTILAPSSEEIKQGRQDAWESHFEESTDGGLSWRRLRPIPFIGKMIQPSIWLATDGTVRMVGRTRMEPARQRFMALARCDERGHRCAAAKLTTVPCPNSGLDALKLQDGRVVVIYNHSFKEGFAARNVLALQISEDDGDSWRRILTLEQQTGLFEFSYPSVIQAANGMVHVIYTYSTHPRGQGGRENLKHVILDPKLF
ncbi:hypothetical protein CYMTET_31495 [Cymbomonas tetramitiformis]|uniref:Sialidase domain-containing protein n=1 Tax=Cymbomonas tetramitiformis TaxID=36881 RepID=A0AAE0FH31_9CHLO|nr:hypothetical protein CYMTET_31495 [Cymbomonas tetramitiformis]